MKFIKTKFLINRYQEKFSRSNRVYPENWGLSLREDGSLTIGKYTLVDIADTYGTPLHIINLPRLTKTGNKFLSQIARSYPGKTSVHFAFKSNSVPAVVKTIKLAGLKAEVMTDYELDLALHLGYAGAQIIVNGPYKSKPFLEKCLQQNVRFVVVDALSELEDLNHQCEEMNRTADILLRINPDYTPHGMNSGTATGNRKACAFGLDLKSGEADRALDRLHYLKFINFCGFHMHIGTGIRDPRDYARAIKKLFPLFRRTMGRGLQIKCLDVGGGFASFTTREFTTTELLLQQGLKYLPKQMNQDDKISFYDFGRVISEAVLDFFPASACPELIFEPGRCIVSPNQFLVLTVHSVKNRPAAGCWIVTDGGLGTSTLPTYYEYHEVFLCNEADRPHNGRATIIGPCCFAADIVYRNKSMPQVFPGEKIVIMDTGAYFTALESSFGFPRPAIAAVSPEKHFLIRRREDFEEMIRRDQFK